MASNNAQQIVIMNSLMEHDRFLHTLKHEECNVSLHVCGDVCTLLKLARNLSKLNSADSLEDMQKSVSVNSSLIDSAVQHWPMYLSFMFVHVAILVYSFE